LESFKYELEMLTTGRDVQNYTAVVFIENLQHKQRIVTSYSSFEKTNLLAIYIRKHLLFTATWI
jgi:hypothetical protein